jgi:ribonuclease-3
MNRRLAAIEALEKRLGHAFGDRELLERALTHASATGGSAKIASNERLEFLGDRVLGLIIADALVSRDGAANVGDLSKRLHVLVSGDICARVAREIGLGDALRLQGASPASGVRENTTILSDACEALIAALYLELGLERTSSIVLKLWERFLDEPLDLGLVNPKSELQEWAAANGHAQPVYRVLARSGPDHRPIFTVAVALGSVAPVTAEGGSVRIAEKAAALALLTRERGAS